MAILKRRLNFNNTDGVSSTIHFETSADLVLCADNATVEEKLETLAADAAKVPSMIKQETEAAVAAIVDDSPEAFDTLKEFYEWIQTHETDATAMNNKITDLLARVAALEKKQATFALLELS